MSGYFGTDAQRALQARVVDSFEWIRTTPGACVGGRFMACDDVETLGWETIDSFLDRDGVFGFRMLSASKTDTIAERLSRHGFRLDRWNVFVGDRASGLASSSRIVADGLPAGI